MHEVEDKMKSYPLYHNTLCPKLWTVNEDGAKLDNEVRNGLLKVAQDFVKELKDSNGISIKVDDIVIIGSATNYNWTNYSDIDLHVVTDYKKLDMSAEDAQTLFDAIKVGWNNKHDITMKGHDVEIYVQDKAHIPTSASEYSVLNDKWLKEPVKESPKFDKDLIKKKYKEYKNKISSLVKKHDEDALKKLLEKLYKYRQSGLDKGGELSEENIVFKILRAYGHLDKIKDSISNIYDKKMSVKESLLDGFDA
jgi:predicted nucleotidyltransferase